MSNYEFTAELGPRLDALIRLVHPMTSRLLRRVKPDQRQQFDQDHIEQVLVEALMGDRPQGLISVLLNKSHVLLFQVGKPWYTNEYTLYEQLFVRVGPGELTDALSALRELACDYNCNRITLGSLLAPNDEAFTALLTPHGYNLAAHVLIKEIT